MATPGVINVQHTFIGREGETVGQEKIIAEQREGAQIGREAVHTGEGQVPLLGREGTGPWIRVVDTAVRLDHHVIGTVKPPPLEAVGDYSEAAVELLPSHPAAIMLAGQ